MSRHASSPAAGSPRTVSCPVCGTKCAFEPWNPWRPFCSERCRTTDLGGWASEAYRVPGKPDTEDSGGGNEDPASQE